VLGISREDEPEDALDLVYQSIDRWMRGDRFDIVKEVLALADPNPLPLVVALAYVSITRPAHESLSEARAGYISRVRERMMRTDPDDIEELLSGLE
jgi:hypothetical protein